MLFNHPSNRHNMIAGKENRHSVFTENNSETPKYPRPSALAQAEPESQSCNLLVWGGGAGLEHEGSERILVPGGGTKMAHGLFLLVALLVLGMQVPAACWRRKGEKLGGCPADDTPCLWQRPDQCSEDSQCPRLKKCCSRACYRQCLPPVRVKLGDCPKDDLLCLSPIQHLCGKDTDCSGIQKCCLAACGRDCREPAKG
ncbi:WAP four-disulfide core domain protein 5-like [Ornithorhynchus anatinus]|uniref:WAP four-disulfide core domain protein 5-like n=1 Tax=Ornithorhynchus anatinus TaxID=9258 RepID=UPI0004549D26|nr:WAP four-disulfide core domain protein 5-like [Ornithorhynchus anatinus]